MKHAAILIVDVLQDFFQEGRLLEHKERLVERTNDLVQIGRESGLPIIWVRQEFEPDLSDAFLGMKKTGRKVTIKGTDGCQLLPGLDAREEDHEIVKKRYSAFFETELEALLKKLGVETVVIAGVNTQACVRMAAIDGYQRDFEIILAEECVDSYDEEYHRVSLRYLTQSIAELKTNDQVRDWLK